MTRKELPARAANILRAVASTTACSPATVESLRSFLTLNEPPIEQQKKAPEKPVQPRRKPTTIAPVIAVGARGRKQFQVAILEIPGDGDDCLQAQDRVALATEVANLALKALTEAIKRPSVQRKRNPLARSSSNASFSNGANSRSQTLLQPLCVNRVTDSPSKQCHTRRSSSTASATDTLDGLRAQAECARVAYATLRSMQGSKELPALAYLQLESGMSALSAKLIVLGFDDLAVRELRILRQRLETPGEPSAKSKTAVSTVLVSEGEKPGAKEETLPGMLRFRNIDVDGPRLALIIALQLQVLKILALRREASAVRSALHHLGLEVSYSPAVLIQRQVDPDAPESQARAARQLESLAQVLLALSPAVSSTDSHEIASASSGLPAEIAFQIQLLALRIRFMWWKLSGHNSNVMIEMIRPFSRYLTAFHRKSRLGRKEKYDMARSAFQIISECIRNLSGFEEEMFLDVYQSLAGLAQDSSEHSEALRWIRTSGKYSTQCGTSRTQLCTLACRSATLYLRAAGFSPDEKILKSLQEAAITLEGDLHGESTELDELLVVVASLRKSAFSVVQDSHRISSTDPSVLAEECRNIVLLCLKFIVRYVGNGSGPNENDKTLARRKQRKRSAEQVAAPAVESVAAMARFAAGAPLELWQQLEAGLRDCFELISRLEHADDDAIQDQIINKLTSSCFVSISNAYWYRFIRLKQGATEAKRLRGCLRTSIDLLKDRSPTEKIAGFLPMKLERCGQLYENLHEYNKAAEAYEEALSTLLESGLLQTATEAAATRSLPLVFESGGELGPLSRMLLAYPSAALKAAAKGQDLNLFYDPEGLCASERGILLEQQLMAVSSILLDRGPSEVICNAVDGLAENLLSLYTSEVFPVRRFRVVVRLLGLLLTSPGVLQNDLQGQLLQERDAGLASNHSDVDLLQFLPHLITSQTVLVTLIGGILIVGKIEKALKSWSRMVQEYPDWESLQIHVYDIMAWLMLLELLAEYLEMQNLDLLRVSTLHLLVTVHEAATSIHCPVLVSKLSALATQYSRLGYCGRAGLVLHKAQRHLESSDIAANTALKWHLSHAEYALANGSLSVW